MDPDEVERTRLTFIKDALISAYHARNLFWQAVAGAALAAAGFTAVGHRSGQLSEDSFRVLISIELAATALAALILAVAGRWFERDFKALLSQLERLKPGERP